MAGPAELRAARAGESARTYSAPEALGSDRARFRLLSLSCCSKKGDLANQAQPPERESDMTQSVLSEFDRYLLAEGTFHRAYQKLGAHVTERNGQRGVQFAVWAPHAKK